MTVPDAAQIERFLHDQVDAWNRGDREAFFAAYQQMAPNGLRIEYVGQPPADGWPILKTMWEGQAGKVRAEVVAKLINGSEAACYHLNHVLPDGPTVKTVEIYAFGDGTLDIRYFVGR